MRFTDVKEESDDSMPNQFRHIIHSERRNHEEFYLTIANLVGHGLSNNVASSTIVEVGNKLFDRK